MNIVRRALKYIELAERECEECSCGFTTDNRLEIHHIDGNRYNNNPDNHIILCQQCHSGKHYSNREGRLETMTTLRSQGLTYAEIGNIFNISRQRVHIILNKKDSK